MTDARDTLLDELASVISRTERVPADVVWQAKAAFGWRNMSTQIASLEYDSLVDDDDRLARVRGVGSERVLRFRAPDAIARLFVADGARRLVGQLEPATFRSVELRQTTGSTTVGVDDSGTFLIDRLPRGVVSLKFDPVDPEDASFETEWVTI